jgi:AraC-like DNA-binding protein
MDRRIRKVVRILPELIFSPPPGNSEVTDENNGKRMRDRLLLKRAAEEVNLSIFHLCRLFKAEMNMTFKQYADNLMMEKAMEMANNGYLTVGQIVNEIGAGDDRNFRRRLKKTHGLTLSQLRKISDEYGEDESGKENDGNK